MGIIQKVLKAAEQWAVKNHKTPTNYDEQKLKTLHDIAHTIPCGSVLLCSGTAAESRLIEEIDQTDFSHAAMIVKFHDNDELLLWTADTVDIMDDQIHKEKNVKHAGSHLLKLKDYIGKLDEMYPSPDGSRYRFAVARLSDVDIDEKKLWKILYEYDGTPFPPTSEEFLHWIEGQLNIDCGMENSFCAQMVANTYQKMGWLSSHKPPNAYNPGSFAKTTQINTELNGSARLEKPEYFKLNKQ